LAPLVVFVFWIGLKPQTFLAPMQADINAVTTVVQAAYVSHEWNTGEIAPAVAAQPTPAAAPAAPAVQQNSEFARVD